MGNIIKSHNAKLLRDNKSISQKCNCQKKEECPLKGKCMKSNIVYLAQVTTEKTNREKSDTNTSERITTRYNLRGKMNNNNSNEINNINNSNDTNDLNNINDTNDTSNENSTLIIKKEMFYIGAAEDFKKRYANHLKSFRHEKYKNETTLSSHFWHLKEKGRSPNIKWSVAKRAPPYNPASKKCRLCLTEKTLILEHASDPNMLNTRTEMFSKCRHRWKHVLAALR